MYENKQSIFLPQNTCATTTEIQYFNSIHTNINIVFGQCFFMYICLYQSFSEIDPRCSKSQQLKISLIPYSGLNEKASWKVESHNMGTWVTNLSVVVRNHADPISVFFFQLNQLVKLDVCAIIFKNKVWLASHVWCILYSTQEWCQSWWVRLITQNHSTHGLIL